MRRIALCVLVSFSGCETGQLDVEDRPIVVDEVPSAAFDDNGEQVSQQVRLSGTVADDQVLMLLHCRLSTEQAGVLWEGNPNPDGTWEWQGQLSPGRHDVRLEVEDASGNVRVEEYPLMVRYNEMPSCDIMVPRPGDYNLDQEIEFRANADDPDNDALMLFWSSDQEGTLFEGDSWSLRLQSPGNHLISFEVVDAYGAKCVDQVEITVY